MKRWLIPLFCISLCTFLLSWERTAQAGSVERILLRADDGTVYYVIRFNTLGTEKNNHTTLYLENTDVSNTSFQKAQSGTCGGVGTQVVKAASGVSVAGKLFDITAGKHSGIVAMDVSPGSMVFDPTGSGSITYNQGSSLTFSCGQTTDIFDLDVGGGGVPIACVKTYSNPFGAPDPANLTAYVFPGGGACPPAAGEPTVQQDVSGGCPAFPADGFQLAGGQGVIFCWTTDGCFAQRNFVAGTGSIEESAAGNFNGTSHADSDNVTGCTAGCTITCTETGEITVACENCATGQPLPCTDLQVKATSSNPSCITVNGGATATIPVNDATCTASFTIARVASGCGACITYELLDMNDVPVPICLDEAPDGPATATCCWPGIACNNNGVVTVVRPSSPTACDTACDDECNSGCLEVRATVVPDPGNDPGCVITVDGGAIATHQVSGTNCSVTPFDVECSAPDTVLCPDQCEANIVYTLVNTCEADLVKDVDTCTIDCCTPTDEFPALTSKGTVIFAGLLMLAGSLVLLMRRRRTA